MSTKSTGEKRATDEGVMPEDQKNPRGIGTLNNINERKLMAKVDIHLLPILCLLYVFAFIDRVNFGNSLLYGLPEDTALSSRQYNICLCVFFATHVASQIPANLLMKRAKPHIFLSVSMIVFGFLVIMQGFCHDFGELVAVRFFLGAAESGVFPGCFYVISMWYKRTEAQKRFTFFFMAASLAGAFGGLLASAFGSLQGTYGHNGWRWIFWIEGSMTCACSALAFLFIPDFPEDTKWLHGEERTYIVNRLAEDQGDSEWQERLSASSILATFHDPKMIPVAFMYFGPSVAGVGMMYFLSPIVATYGYGPTMSQLLTVPPWICALIFSMLVAVVSDRLRHRFGFVVLGHVVALAGGITLFRLHGNSHAQYAAIFLYLMGTVCCVPLVIGWNVMNLRGHTKRAVGTAWQICVGNMAGFISAWSFPEEDAPQYQLGFSLGIGFLAASFTMSIVYFVMCWMENRKLLEKGLPLLVL